jgi:hypothetical protein
MSLSLSTHLPLLPSHPPVTLFILMLTWNGLDGTLENVWTRIECGVTMGNLSCSLSAKLGSQHLRDSWFLRGKERVVELHSYLHGHEARPQPCFPEAPLTLQLLSIGTQPEHSQDCGPAWRIHTLCNRQTSLMPRMGQEALKSTQRASLPPPLPSSKLQEAGISWSLYLHVLPAMHNARSWTSERQFIES